jgi:oxygen-dependent protoporphyrinogen oxidase
MTESPSPHHGESPVATCPLSATADLRPKGEGEASKRVAIIGGGISGLAAAQRLATLDAAIDVTLFESSPRLGGVLQTDHVDGFCMELGPDSILSRLPWAVDLCHEIGLDNQLVSTSASPSGVHVVCRGRLERIPEGLALMAPRRIWPFVTTRILSWRGKLRLAADYVIPRRRADGDETLAEFSRRRLGRETFERLVQPLASGIYMGDPERLSVRATFPQFVEMEANHGSLIRAARAAMRKGHSVHHTGGPQYSLFVAPRRGMVQLVEALAARLAGCQVRCNERVEGLERAGSGGWQLDVVDVATGERRQESFEGVIVALPTWQASPLLSAASPELSGLLSAISYAGCIVVNLAYDLDAIGRPLDSFGFVSPHVERRAVVACTFSSVKYPDRAPAGKALVRAFLGGACRPEVFEWSDGQVLDTVRDELRELLDVREPPLFSRIVRWKRSMPQYNVGHLERVKCINELARALPGLELAGNGYGGVGIPHCIHTGRQAAERLAATLSGTARPECC